MNVYVWDYICAGLTSSWHSGGGVLAVAETVDAARELIRGAAKNVEDIEDDLAKEPEHTWSVTDNAVSEVVIFADMGCC